jgi:c-di-GMP-binding flagellar brake protein YcgR
MLEKERRQDERFRCTGNADVRRAVDAPPLSARIVDVSNGGCLIVLHKSQKFLPNETVELAFNVNRLPFRMQGQAASIRSDTTVGFKFSALSRRVRWQLDELIEELAADWRKRFEAHRWSAEDFR